MEESFRIRVDKAFGALSSSQSPSSLWSLTDDEIEPQPWSRETQDEYEAKEKKLNSNLFECLEKKYVDYEKLFEKDLEDELSCEDSDNDDDEASGSGSKDVKGSGEFGDEELEIKSSIGLDPTLDNEEEEDEYDKVAVGKEKAGDRLYMKDVNDYETDADYYNTLPSSFRDIDKDPRANTMAAKVRLLEDDEAAENLDAEAARKIETLKVSDEGGDCHPKSILKRKDDQSDSKSQKRVRFDTECKANSGEDAGAGEAKVSQEDLYSFVETKEDLIKVSSTDEVDKAVDGLPMESCSMAEDRENLMKGCSADGAKDVHVEAPTEGVNQVMVESYSSGVTEYIQTGGNGGSSIEHHPSQVPAYLRNPSKYTHYTFDSSTDMDEESNRQAFMDFFNLIKKSKTTDLQPEDEIFDSSKPVAFIPRRKYSGGTAGESEALNNQTLEANKELAYQKGYPVGLVAMDDVCEMEEDELETYGDRRNSARRSGRQYRTKARTDSDESQS